MCPCVASDLMRKDFLHVNGDTEVEAALDAALQEFERPSGAPVVVISDDQGRYEGILTMSAALSAAMALTEAREGGNGDDRQSGGRERTRVRRYMSTDAPTVSPEESLGDVIRKMVEGGVDAAPVLQGNRLTGIVTVEDVFDRVAQEALVDVTSPFVAETPPSPGGKAR